jgi:hypothetical protein
LLRIGCSKYALELGDIDLTLAGAIGGEAQPARLHRSKIVVRFRPVIRAASLSPTSAIPHPPMQ